MFQRARSAEAKLRRAEDLLEAARTLAEELGAVRHITLAAVTGRAAVHPSAVRRYFTCKEDLLLTLAERGWCEWADAVVAMLNGRSGLDARAAAGVLSTTLASRSLFCDLLTHIPLGLEGEVDIERARQYKTISFQAYDRIVEAFDSATVLDSVQAADLVAAALAVAANAWQVAHPTPTLRALYAQEPRWAHEALDFEPRLTRLLTATAVGLIPSDSSASPHDR